ncbi:hypothetical protein LCGC14_2662360, partial [marine sediment metagenome]
AGQRGNHAGHRFRPGGVDALDPRMRVFAAQDFRVQHVGEGHVVDIAGLAGDMRAAVGPGDPLADRRRLRPLVVKPDGELLAESKSEVFAEEMVVADLAVDDLLAARGRKCFSLINRRPGAYAILADPNV